MQLRRSRGALVLLASASIVFGACSSGASPSPAPATAGPTSGSSAGASPGATAGASGDDISGQTVKIIATWSGDEQKAFLAMVAPWEQKTGAKVSYTGTRDINTILATGVASGVLPDLAGLPGPGQMNEYYKAGALKTLDDVLDLDAYKADTAKALVDLGTTSDGKIGGVFIKAAVKGLIWYNPKLHDYASAPPATWDDLTSQATANKGAAQSIWCVGLESGAASGWPGTDWIEDFVLRTAGPQVYNDWAAGKVTFSDPKIKNAFTLFGDVIKNAYGGAATVNTTAFQSGGDPLFANPPGCEFHHQASFITGLGAFKPLKAGTDYNFFPFPDIDTQYAGAVEGAADLFGMFHDTPAAKSLMAYLVTPEAQDIWVKIGGALSANNKAVDYPDDIAKRSADLLNNAKIFVFDASDLMPNALQSAFLTGIVDYVKDPTKLDSILANLDSIQKTAYTS
jgi:alpha-glucoside transport system substrate-binding protein